MSGSTDQQQQFTFREFWEKSHALMRDQQYKAAIRLTERSLEIHTEMRLYLILFLAALHVADGNTQAAIGIFTDGMKKGEWYTKEVLLQVFPDIFKPVIGDLTLIFDRWAEMRAKDEAASKIPPLFTYPSHHNPSTPTPLFLSLHGSGETAAWYKNKWHTSGLEQGFICAYPQSSCLCAHNQPSWDDHARRRMEIPQTVSLAAEKNRIDYKSSVIGGFSQGGGIALEYALTNVLGIQNCIALCPTVPPIKPEHIQSADGAPRIYLILGSKDERTNTRVETLTKILRDSGVAYKTVMAPDLAHGFPHDLPEHIERGLQWIHGTK